MTREEVKAELDREPFLPLRIYHRDGRVFLVRNPKEVWVLGTALFIAYPERPGSRAITGHDLVSYIHIDRVETVPVAATA
jgi:hypothetical protein